MGHHGDQPQYRDASPTSAFHPSEDRCEPRTAIEIDQPRANVARDKKACDRSDNTAQFGPKDTPPNAKQQPCNDGEQSTWDKQQAGCAVDRKKSEWRCRISANRSSNRYWIENAL